MSSLYSPGARLHGAGSSWEFESPLYAKPKREVHADGSLDPDCDDAWKRLYQDWTNAMWDKDQNIDIGEGAFPRDPDKPGKVPALLLPGPDGPDNVLGSKKTLQEAQSSPIQYQ